MMDKEKAIVKLKTLTWEELDWLEKKCAEYKPSANGARVFKNEEAVPALVDYFQSTFNKHHGY